MCEFLTFLNSFYLFIHVPFISHMPFIPHMPFILKVIFSFFFIKINDITKIMENEIIYKPSQDTFTSFYEKSIQNFSIINFGSKKNKKKHPWWDFEAQKKYRMKTDGEAGDTN
jgi:hypothetical protein